MSTKLGEVHIQLPPREERDGDSMLLVWEQSDIEAIPDESSGPSIWDLAPMVATRLAAWQIDGKRDMAPRTLEEYSQWIVGLQRGTAKPTPKIEQKVRDLLKEAPEDPRTQARILHDWVKRNIRYVAIEIGLGGWRPYTAEQVFEWRYGDCKDMSTLLKAMLDVAGIDSHLVTLYSHRGVPRDFVLPALGFTNHAILGIDLPDGLVVVDPTERTVPFGELPPRDQEAKLLVNHPAEPYVYESPPSEAHRNLRAVDATFQQSEEDPRAWTGQIDLRLKGAYGARFLGRMLETSGDEQGEVIAAWSRFAFGTVSGHGFHEAYEGDEWSASAKVDVQFSQAGAVSGNRLVLRCADLLRPLIDPRTEKERKTSLVYSFRRTNDHRVRLELSEGTEVRSLPDPQTFETKFGTYAIEWAAPEPGILELRRHFVLAQRTIPPDEFAAFKRFIEQVLRAERQAVVLGVSDA